MSRSEVLIIFAAGLVLLLSSGCAGAATALAARQAINDKQSSKLLVDPVPEDKTLEMAPGETVQLEVTRKYSSIPGVSIGLGNTETEIVTAASQYDVDDEAVAKITPTGNVIAVSPGVTDANVSFDTKITDRDNFDFQIVVEAQDSG